MKKFILHIIIFGTIVLGLAFVADYVISKNLRQQTNMMELYSWNAIYSGNLHSDLIIQGSSRGYVNYNPQILDSILGVNSFNLGNSTNMIVRQIIKYNTYRRFNIKPKYIIQNIDCMTIQFNNEFREQFFPYFFDDSLRRAIAEYENFSLFEKYFPAYRYMSYYSFTTTLGGTKDKGIKGYYGLDRQWDGSRIPETEIDYDQDSVALSLFDKYLAKAYSENIKVIFVYAPMYMALTEKIKNMEGMYQMYDSIARKYDIPILDYNFDPMSYDTIYFFDATHLNKRGAEHFSVKLAHDIDSLGILTK